MNYDSWGKLEDIAVGYSKEVFRNSPGGTENNHEAISRGSRFQAAIRKLYLLNMSNMRLRCNDLLRLALWNKNERGSERIILGPRCVIDEQFVKVWARLIWLRTESRCGFCKHNNEPSPSLKAEIFWSAE
jgi:hypothetical protein